MINVRKFLRSKDKFSDCKSPSNRLKMMHVNLIMVRLNTNIGEKGWSKRFQREKTLFTKSESESCSVVSDSWWPHELIPPMEFSRPEYWSGYPFPSPGDFPNPEIEPRSPELQVDYLPDEPQGKPIIYEGHKILIGTGLKEQYWKQCLKKCENYFQPTILIFS